GVGRIRCGPSGDRNGRGERTAANAVAQGHIAGFVHGNAAHPAEASVWSKGALLRHTYRSIRILQLIPANASIIIGTDRHRAVYDQRFMIAEIAIGKPVHQAVSE